jgi:uncharacterized protein YodC (DUF2158 family)
MEASKIKTGDLVMLNSGGPIMTVNGFISNQVMCVWFDKENGLYHYKSAQFYPAALKSVEPVPVKD